MAIEAGPSLKGDDSVRTLDRLKLERGVLTLLLCNNGSESTSHRNGSVGLLARV
jgi:putative transposase